MKKFPENKISPDNLVQIASVEDTYNVLKEVFDADTFN